MKIELTKIKHNPSLSHETENFTGVLLIDGHNCGVAYNSGEGGETFLTAKDATGLARMEEAEKYLNAEAQTHDPDGNSDTLYPKSLSEKADNLLYAYLNKKERLKYEKELAKVMETGLAIGVPDGDSFNHLKLLKSTLLEYLSTEKGRDTLARDFHKIVLPKLKEGEKIINTNLPEEFSSRPDIKSHVHPYTFREFRHDQTVKKVQGRKR